MIPKLVKLKRELLIMKLQHKEFNKLTAENFAAKLKQSHLATEADIDNFIETPDFDEKLKKLNKEVTSNKSKHLETEKKLTDITNKVAQISEKGYDF